MTPESGSEYRKITIVGTGLMGGSLGLALKQLPFVDSVWGYDIKPENSEKALELGAIDQVAMSWEEAGDDCSLLIICAPVGFIVSCFREAIPYLSTGTLVTDVGSTKLRITQQIDEICPQGIYYVGGHPMVGSEQSGVESARGNLYQDCYYILTPTYNTDMDAFQRLHRLLSSIGARVISLDPEQHDRAMAIVSHVPHILSLLLMGLTARHTEEMQSLLHLAAGGFRDMTRIAASNPDLWIDICLDNLDFISDYLHEFAGELVEIVRILKEGDRERLRELFWEANRARREIPVKPGVDTEDLYEIQIPVKDRPGALSAVTTEIGSMGTNIEDISIVHPLEGETGILGLVILGADEAEKTKERLQSLGYSVNVRRM